MFDCSEENGETQIYFAAHSSLLYGLNDIKVHFDLTGAKTFLGTFAKIGSCTEA